MHPGQDWTWVWLVCCSDCCCHAKKMIQALGAEDVLLCHWATARVVKLLLQRLLYSMEQVPCRWTLIHATSAGASALSVAEVGICCCTLKCWVLELMPTATQSLAYERYLSRNEQVCEDPYQLSLTLTLQSTRN